MLRRLIANARRQDWFAVTVELFVVVLGIFIGMQVTNWNEDRKLARQAHEYRESLATDLATDEDTMRAHADYFRVIEQYGKVALGYLDEPGLGAELVGLLFERAHGRLPSVRPRCATASAIGARRSA